MSPEGLQTHSSTERHKEDTTPLRERSVVVNEQKAVKTELAALLQAHPEINMGIYDTPAVQTHVNEMYGKLVKFEKELRQITIEERQAPRTPVAQIPVGLPNAEVEHSQPDEVGQFATQDAPELAAVETTHPLAVGDEKIPPPNHAEHVTSPENVKLSLEQMASALVNFGVAMRKREDLRLTALLPSEAVKKVVEAAHALEDFRRLGATDYLALGNIFQRIRINLDGFVRTRGAVAEDAESLKRLTYSLHTSFDAMGLICRSLNQNPDDSAKSAYTIANWRQPLPRGLPRVPCRKV